MTPPLDATPLDLIRLALQQFVIIVAVVEIAVGAWMVIDRVIDAVGGRL